MKLIEARIVVLDKITLIYDMLRGICIVDSLADYNIVIPLKRARVIMSAFNVRIADETGFVADIYLTPYTGLGFKNYYMKKLFSIEMPGFPSFKFDFNKKCASMAHARFIGQDFYYLLLLSYWMLKYANINPDIISSTAFALDIDGQYQSTLPYDILAIVHDYIDCGFTAWNLARLP